MTPDPLNELIDLLQVTTALAQLAVEHRSGMAREEEFKRKHNGLSIMEWANLEIDRVFALHGLEWAGDEKGWVPIGGRK